MERQSSAYSSWGKEQTLENSLKNTEIFKNEEFLALNPQLSQKLLNEKTPIPIGNTYAFDLLEVNEKYSELLKTLKNTNSFKSFSKKLLLLKDFKNIESIVIFSHHRGQPLANGIHFSFDSSYKNLKCEVGKFSTLFNQVKKSKNKIFNNSTSPSEILPLIGTYLAHTITTNSYDLIFIVSRNDFLPPDQEEINSFGLLAESFSPFFSHILESQDSEARQELIGNMLGKSIIPFRVLKNSKEIYRSPQYLSSDTVKEIKLDNNLVLEYSNEQEYEQTSEIFHYQRVAILGELLNTLQHELSNPLFGIRLSSELLLMESKSDEIRDFLQQILDSTIRCQNIIKDFSTLYTIGEDREWFNLSKTIKESITLSKSATQNIYKEVIIEHSLEDLEIFSNPRWINQIVFNAIINSAQALNSLEDKYEKKVTIKLSMNLTDIEISVIDNGPGIDHNAKESLFSPFFTTKQEGTGLGLSICKNLAEKLDAEVFLKNNNTKGCTFSLMLKNEENTTRRR